MRKYFLKRTPKTKLQIDDENKTEFETKNKITKTEPKIKTEVSNNSKINSDVKKKIALKSEPKSIIEKDQKFIKNEVTAKPELYDEKETIKTFITITRNSENQNQKH